MTLTPSEFSVVVNEIQDCVQLHNGEITKEKERDLRRRYGTEGLKQIDLEIRDRKKLSSIFKRIQRNAYQIPYYRGPIQYEDDTVLPENQVDPDHSDRSYRQEDSSDAPITDQQSLINELVTELYDAESKITSNIDNEALQPLLERYVSVIKRVLKCVESESFPNGLSDILSMAVENFKNKYEVN